MSKLVDDLMPEHRRAIAHMIGIFSDVETQLRADDSAHALERRKERAEHEANLAAARKEHALECAARAKKLDERWRVRLPKA
jgi:hypothetical protein